MKAVDNFEKETHQYIVITPEEEMGGSRMRESEVGLPHFGDSVEVNRKS